jgi:CheY-like chemotaxis protein
MGYAPDRVAATGTVALQRIEARPPDIVLMDINLDGEIDGIETASRIPPELMIPVIYLTAYSGAETLDRVKANPYGFLVKPFSDDTLRATIALALDRRAKDFAALKTEAQQRTGLASSKAVSSATISAANRLLETDHIGWISDALPKTVAETFRDFLQSVHEDDRHAVQTAFTEISDEGDGSGAVWPGASNLCPRFRCGITVFEPPSDAGLVWLHPASPLPVIAGSVAAALLAQTDCLV